MLRHKVGIMRINCAALHSCGNLLLMLTCLPSVASPCHQWLSPQQYPSKSAGSLRHCFRGGLLLIVAEKGRPSTALALAHRLASQHRRRPLSSCRNQDAGSPGLTAESLMQPLLAFAALIECRRGLLSARHWVMPSLEQSRASEALCPSQCRVGAPNLPQVPRPRCHWAPRVGPRRRSHPRSCRLSACQQTIGFECRCRLLELLQLPVLSSVCYCLQPQSSNFGSPVSTGI